MKRLLNVLRATPLLIVLFTIGCAPTQTRLPPPLEVTPILEVAPEFTADQLECAAEPPVPVNQGDAEAGANFMREGLRAGRDCRFKLGEARQRLLKPPQGDKP